MSDLGDFTSSLSTDDAPSDTDTGADRESEADRFEESDISPTGTDSGIGTVPASQGLKIAEDGDDTEIQAYITAGNRSGIRLGKYLLVPYPDGEKLFCRITGLEYAQEFRADDATEIHARRAMRNGGVEERDYKFLATVEPVAVLYSDGDDLKRRMADRVPKPETTVREATDVEEIKTGLKMPDDGVFMGHLAVGGEKVRTAAEPPTIDYRLKDDYEAGDPLVFRHTLVAGGTGSGKTHAAKNVLRQYLGDDRSYGMDDGRTVSPAVVQFDPQDEYAQMHDDNPAIERDDERAFEREGIAHGGHDDTMAFVPKVGSSTYGADDHHAEQVAFTIPFSMVRENKWLVAGGDLNDNQYNALTYLLDRFFKQHGGSGSYSQFKSFLDDPALREELDESGRVHEATFDAVKRRAYGFDSVFDRDAPPITDLVHRFVRPGGLSVVPTYHINDSRATEVIVLALASLLVDQKLSNDPEFDRIKETPLVLGMDEAHNFLSGAESAQAGKVIGKFAEAAKQGRKERLGLFLITQDPQDIAEPVFKQVNTKLVLNLGDEDAISAVNIPASLQGKVPYMEKGQMVAYSPDNSEPVELIGLPKCLTKHE
ncbi:ATP-binding protein [Halalkalicoccus tibetensis]|uniref:ATP-binding protein n=1 Tax=Halalkalicoccus tibetensis TaxID=175632 RepID=A0ABD5V116_9EURY